jgi:micrococcal nuclease
VLFSGFQIKYGEIKGLDNQKAIEEANCDPSYPGVCIPPYPPDLNCGDVSDKGFEVLPPDPHGFDGDGDGVACES